MSPITNCVLTLFQIFCFTSFGSTENNFSAESKRLLLTDPDVIQGQIHSLESKLQDLSAKHQDAMARIGSLEQKENDVTVRLNTLEQDNRKLTSDISKLEIVNSELQNSRGASYVRWGRTDCPSLNGTELVYSGLAGGGHWDESGNGVNYLCLPHDPDQPHLVSTIIPQGGGLFAHVYGAEYQFSYSNIKLDDDVPCAACLDTHATTSMMIPGKTTCPKNWRKQYEGLLSASQYNHAGPAEFQCLDIHPQYIDGRRNDFNGKLFYPAIAKCGSLQCPPYEEGKYMSCVVCTR